MPGGDETGPLGRGPRTGFGRGQCGGAFASRFGGRGYGRIYGKPMCGTPVILTKEEQIKILEIELKDIDAEKQAIEKELKELKKK